jgi:mannosyl-3-phosphoglycerate phosphatase
MPRELLIFSDLDGTLLDERYRFDAAADALARLRAAGIPLILTSSKTLAEMRAVRGELGLDHPVVFENGAGIAVPEGYFAGMRGGALEVETFGPGYAALRKIIVELRARHGFQFKGFGDMTPHEVAERTGLDELAARRARQRLGSEPGIWQSTEAIRQDFLRELAGRGLHAVRGGRFLHVMPDVDKAVAMHRLVERYRAIRPGERFRVIAAGDSPNDLDMLEAADTAVVIRRTDGSWMPLRRQQGVMRSREPGPAGWQQCMLEILDQDDDAAGEDEDP